MPCAASDQDAAVASGSVLKEAGKNTSAVCPFGHWRASIRSSFPSDSLSGCSALNSKPTRRSLADKSSCTATKAPTYAISGVFADMPKKRSLDFDAAIRFENRTKYGMLLGGYSSSSK